MDWNEKSDALLIKLWDEGGSLEYVAAEMNKVGYHVSRNAIAGRKHRLKHQLKREISRAPGTLSVNRVQKPKRINVQRSATMHTLRLRPSIKPVTSEQLAAISDNRGVDYLDNVEGCKALLGIRGADGLPRCCGMTRGLDFRGGLSPYCPTHFRLFVNPTSQGIRSA